MLGFVGYVAGVSVVRSSGRCAGHAGRRILVVVRSVASASTMTGRGYAAPIYAFDRDAEDITNLKTSLISESRSKLDELAAIPIWGETELRTLADVNMGFETGTRACSFPMYVSMDPLARDSAANAEKDIDAYRVEVSQREDIFLAVKKLSEQVESGDVPLDAEWRRWMEKLLRDFRRAGLELAKNERDELAELNKRLSELCTEFSKNLNEDVSSLTFSAEELDGMDEHWLASLPKADDGKYVVTTKYPDFIPVMQKCKVAETRRQMDLLKGSVCQDKNVPLFEEALELRQKIASVLGYDTYADFALEVRMAKAKGTVLDFLRELQEKLKPYARKELERLCELKQAECEEQGREYDGAITSWDMQYYHTMLMDREYQLDQQKLQEYFPLEVVTQGMHHIYQTILGLRFDRIEKPPGLWHEDVSLYAVYDRASGSFIGQFYLDMFPREGKYGHAAVFGLQRAGQKSDGTRQLPCCAMLCNFTKPSAERPSLLTFKEVETYFHEFGHVMHNICTEASVPAFSCTSVERDFVEAPSQMLENWCFAKEPLEMMSGHYKDQSKLPEELLGAVIRSKNVDTGLLNLRQIFFGTFDMTCHTATGKLDTEKLWRDLRSEVSLIPQQEGCNPTAGFAHLMGGYEAGYYGYLWSQVYSADLFATFDDRLLDPEMGMRYRKAILAPGGSVDGLDAVRSFLGREPNQENFLKNIGIAA